MRCSPLGLCTLLGVLAAPSLAGQADQLALAVMPLPDAEKAGATVHGYQDGELVLLRQGTGDFVCLADRPGDDRFQAACYHESLEPYMARGRALRTEGITGQASIRKRWEEIEAGTLDMPRHPAALYQVIKRSGVPSSATDMDGAQRLTVIYMAYATAEQTGFPAQPAPGVPWMMYSGQPTAHLMIMN